MFKTAIRSIQRNKVFSIIHVAGLAIGISVFLLIAEYVASEWNANRLHKDFERIYRVNLVTKEGPGYYLAPGYVPILKEKFPEVESATSLAVGLGDGVVTYRGNGKEQRSFREGGISYVEGSFFELFSFPILRGEASLARPYTLAITSSKARKIFGNDDVVGKTLSISNQFGKTDFTVTSVLKDLPANSDIRGDIFLSLQTLDAAANRDGNDWADPKTLSNGYANIFVKTRKGTDPVRAATNIINYFRTVDEEAKKTDVYLQPLANMHLAPSLDYPFQTYGSLKLVYMLGLVALLILGIAWVNYINLSTVQAMRRAKETGVRKVLGANRWQLSLQFLSETFLTTMLSLVLAVALVQLLQPLFNAVLRADLSLAALADPRFLLLVLAIVLAGSLLAGGYVSFVLSSFKPVATLKGKLQHSAKGVFLRKGLVVFQFTISLVFIIATMVLYKQLSYMRSNDLGMKLDELLVVQGPTVASEDQSQRNYTFKAELASKSFVRAIAGSNNVPGRGYNFSTNAITRLIPSPGDENKSYNMLIVDQNFFSTYGIKLVDGRTFTENEAIRSWNNEAKVIVNEKAARQLGFEPNDNIVGKKILWGKEFEIVGVVRDYHHLSLRTEIEPVIYLPSVAYGYFTVKTDRANMAGKVREIEKLYRGSFPGNPFEFFFADESYDMQYRQEQDLGRVFIAAALIAIFIACLGLFGLAAFAAQQRIKEIGVRKVLGANVGDITALLSKDFIKLVAVAIIIGCPMAWWLMNKWLQEFPYRTGISWWVFAVAGVAAILIALGTVGFQAVRAASVNPVKSLRSE